ncbi:response regulator transcription factor [bacterium]|nr:response regulator transcription factor [bacterium]
MDKQHRILVVDDAPETTLMMKTILTQAGYKVLTASKGQEALNFLYVNKNIRLVFLDIMLPDMSGYDIMKEISKLEHKSLVKVCFLSGKNKKEDVALAISLGGNDYIVKPVDKELVLDKVRTLFGEAPLAQFANLKVTYSAEFEDEKIKPDILIMEISEEGLLLRSSARLAENEGFEITSAPLKDALGLSDRFMIRVTECQKQKLGQYICKTVWIGLKENEATAIRSIVIRAAQAAS